MAGNRAGGGAKKDGREDPLLASLHVRPHVPKDNFMGGQRRPQVLVHRRVIEGHGQHVSDQSAEAAGQFAGSTIDAKPDAAIGP